MVTLRIYVALLSLLALFACYALPGLGSIGASAARQPDISGTVRGVTDGSAGRVVLLVEYEQAGGTAQLNVTATPATRLLAGATGRADRVIQPAALVTGAHVDVWFTGSIASASPPQAQAARVRITAP